MPHAPAGPAVRFVALVALALTVTIALTMILGPAHHLGRSAAPIREAHARVDQQNDPCPTSSPPGTVLWKFQPPQLTPDERITHIPAVADDGTVVLTASFGRLFAVDCMGNQRWMRDWVENGLGVQFFSGPPAIGDDGTIYATGGFNPSAFLAINANGSTRRIFTTDPIWFFNTAPAVDQRGQVFATADLGRGQFGAIFAFTAEGVPLTGFPWITQPIGGPPVVLADERVVVVSHPLVEGVFPTAPPTLPPPPTPSRPPPTPWRHAVAAIHLPLLLTSQLVAPPADKPPGRSPRPTPVVVTHPALLYVLSPGAPSGLATAFDIGLRVPASSMVALGDRLVLQVHEDGVRRLIAMAIDSNPPRVLWEHVMLNNVAAAPLLGLSDADTGIVELIYLDVGGTLISLKVPGAQDSTTAPRFNWALNLPGTAAGAPVLGDAGLVYAAAGSTVAAFSRVDGSEVWSIDLLGEDTVTTSLTMGPGGVLYLGTQRGRLVAISTESRGLDPEAAWPAFRHDARNSGRAHR